MAEPDPTIEITAATDADRSWMARELTREFCSPQVYSAHQLFDTEKLPALIARRGGRQCGLASYHIDGDECELVAFLTTEQNVGVGTALLRALRELASGCGCHRLFLTTSNDNLAAMRFYQKRGFRFARVHRGALDAARELKPAIPLVGSHCIPMRDDIEFDLPLQTGAD